MANFYIKQSDTLPSIDGTLEDAGGVAVNLTGCTVAFHMAPANTPSKVTVAAGVGVIVGATLGTVRYDWQAGDTASPGTYAAEWQVTFPGGGVERFPNGSSLTVQILAKVA
jgi:hypothetical protein